MPRIPRVAPGGQVYHVFNKSAGKRPLFRTEEDYLAFLGVLKSAMQKHPIRLLAWCVMPDHWHLVIWPRKHGELSRFLGYLTLTHAIRWRLAHKTVGTRKLYRPRFKNFMIQRDEHLLSVLRFVESNALRNQLAKRAQDWRWGSLHARMTGNKELAPLLATWPVDRPSDWTRQVNREQNSAEEVAIKLCLQRGRPFGDVKWVEAQARKFDLHSTIRPQGRQPGWRKRGR